MVKETIVNGKEIKFVGAQGYNVTYGGMETQMYMGMALKILAKHPVDMLIFEMVEGKPLMQVRLAGYDLPTNSILDEETIALTFDSIPSEAFWLKLDDYGDYYVGTFLLPSDY